MSSSLSPAGAVFTSCYKLNSGAATSSVVTVSGTYTLPASNSDYTFTSDASCNLDEANGETVTNIHLDKCANCVGRRGAPRHGPVLLLHDHGLPLDTSQVCRGPGHRQLLQRQLAS